MHFNSPPERKRRKDCLFSKNLYPLRRNPPSLSEPLLSDYFHFFAFLPSFMAYKKDLLFYPVYTCLKPFFGYKYFPLKDKRRENFTVPRPNKEKKHSRLYKKIQPAEKGGIKCF